VRCARERQAQAFPDDLVVVDDQAGDLSLRGPLLFCGGLLAQPTRIVGGGSALGSPAGGRRRSKRVYPASMNGLSEREAQLALDVVAAATSGGDGRSFGLETLDAIVAAVPADEAAYVEWRYGDRHDSVRLTRGEDEPAWLNKALAATCDSYPLRDVDYSGSVEPLRISDVISRARFRKTPFYAAVMRPLGREYELKLWLPAPPGHARYFELQRGPGRDFSERNRQVLSLLRPYLARVRTRLERRPHAPSLTARELDVLELVAQGLTNREISSRLFISPATVRTHLEHIYDKLGVRSRAGAVTAGFRIAS
jgi:DNA-binding NarL/FixJ family response regulator